MSSLVGLAFTTFLLGCDMQTRSHKEATLAPLPAAQLSYQRFELVSSSAFAIALDTKTGQLCHTFNEHLDTYVPATGEFRNSSAAGHFTLDSIPLCIDLSQNEAATVKQVMDTNQARRELDEMQKELNHP